MGTHPDTIGQNGGSSSGRSEAAGYKRETRPEDLRPGRADEWLEDAA